MYKKLKEYFYYIINITDPVNFRVKENSTVNNNATEINRRLEVYIKATLLVI